MHIHYYTSMDEALRCVRATLGAAKQELLRLQLEEQYSQAFDRVEQHLGDDGDVFAKIYCELIHILSQFVMSVDDERSDAVYDIMLMLFFRCGKAFQVLYPSCEFVGKNELYF